MHNQRLTSRPGPKPRASRTCSGDCSGDAAVTGAVDELALGSTESWIWLLGFACSLVWPSPFEEAVVRISKIWVAFELGSWRFPQFGVWDNWVAFRTGGH